MNTNLIVSQTLNLIRHSAQRMCRAGVYTIQVKGLDASALLCSDCISKSQINTHI
jgi:hypothetical protein